MREEGLEIAIAGKQRVAIFDAVSSDQCIDSLANGDTSCAKCPIIFGALQRDLKSADLDQRQSQQKRARLCEMLLMSKSLEHFGQDQITYENAPLTEQRI